MIMFWPNEQRSLSRWKVIWETELKKRRGLSSSMVRKPGCRRRTSEETRVERLVKAGATVTGGVETDRLTMTMNGQSHTQGGRGNLSKALNLSDECERTDQSIKKGMGKMSGNRRITKVENGGSGAHRGKTLGANHLGGAKATRPHLLTMQEGRSARMETARNQNRQKGPKQKAELGGYATMSGGYDYRGRG